jgi:hypothetical protein
MSKCLSVKEMNVGISGNMDPQDQAEGRAALQKYSEKTRMPRVDPVHMLRGQDIPLVHLWRGGFHNMLAKYSFITRK